MSRRAYAIAGLAVALGILTIAAGVLYGAVLVGVPYQDATPELAAFVKFHMAASTTVVAIGAIVAASGIAVGGAVFALGLIFGKRPTA